MSKFKVGDLVKIVKPNNVYGKMNYINQIHKIIRNESDKSEASQWWKLDDNSLFRWQEEELELVEEVKTTELKITANEVKITVDDLYATKPNAINCAEFYEKFNKKEGNKMIESINLIDLYANKHRESIEKETKEKVEELRKECDVINKYNELVEQFEKDCDELYLSQFTEEEKRKIIAEQHIVNDANKQLGASGDLNEYKYCINYDFCNDDYYELMNEEKNKLNEINDLVKTVKAHVGIAKTKEEVEEILTRYGIIDKKGKLVIK